ncbi:MAG: hypothetical protein WC503_03480 [Candidatus Shapirobacteria bacterium]
MIKKILIVLVIVFIAIFILRFSSFEDIWICQNREWIKYGNPSAPKPNTLCKMK